MKQLSVFLGVCLLCWSWWGCSSVQRNLAVDAYGRIDNIIVVADDTDWRAPLGDTFRIYFEALYPVTPQPEAIYELRHVKPDEFNDVLKTHRTIIIIGDLTSNDPASELIKKTLGPEGIKRAQTDSTYRVTVHRDRWAGGQLVIYWFAPTPVELMESVIRHHRTVMQTIQKHDDAKYTTQIYELGMNDSANAFLRDTLRAPINIPNYYYIAYRDSQTIWLRYETNKMSSNIFVRELPLDAEISPKNLRLVRDTLTKRFFTSETENSFMAVDDRIAPLVHQQTVLGGKPAYCTRGLWTMVNDFMGGSFITYLIRDEKRNRVLLIDGFVYAPSLKKRPELRRLDIIFATLKLS